MRKLSGPIMIGIGIFHCLVGFVMGWKIMGDMASDGFFNSVDPHHDRNAIFWFMLTGFLMILLGQVISTIERKFGQRLPEYAGWEFLVFSLTICIMMPISGGWLVLILSIYMIYEARKTGH